MGLGWIDAKDLSRHIEDLQAATRNAANDAAERRVKNVVDPFASLLVATTFGLKKRKQLTKTQDAESALRGMSNAIGRFHQSVLASVDGWEDHDAGYDLECVQRNVVAEVKNKWNTMNATNRQKVEEDLETATRQRGRAWQAYLVLVLPKEPGRYERPLRPRVFEVDGASFYHKVTGDPNAIHDLFDQLCDAVSPSSAIARHCRRVLAGSLPPRE